MRAIILSVGDELVLGQTVDTNSAWLSAKLAAIGVEVIRHETVGDNEAAITEAIRRAASSDLLVITGGLGPTADDLTRQALAAALGRPLELNADWLANIEAFFERLGRKMPETNRIQAMIPAGCEMVWNDHGTAAGIAGKFDGGASFFVMPGVPREMKPMFENILAPRLLKHTHGAVILSRTLHTFGLGESSVAERLGPLMKRDRNPSVGTTVSDGFVSLRINARFDSTVNAKRELESTVEACRAALGDLIWGEDDQTLPQVLATLLRGDDAEVESRTVATAESCTAGLLAKYLTDVAGSSAYFTQGWVCYSNLSKTMLLEIDPRLIDQNGAVSEPVCRAMATRAIELADTDFAISITGVAGPDGGTPDKPVGTVWIGLASRKPGREIDVSARRFQFTGPRDAVRDRAAKMAMTMLRFALLGKPLPF